MQVATALGGIERRRSTRVPSRLPVWYRSPDLELEAVATDLSAGGMFVECDLLDEEGTSADMLLDHYLLKGPVEVHGRVARVSRPDTSTTLPNGMGIQFVGEIPEKAQQFLRRYGSGFERRRVMMVDDEPEILRLLNEWLDRTGHKFLGVQSPFKTMESILSFQPHLVVMDCAMPGLRGPELCKLIHATPALGRVPVLLYSALPEHELQQIAAECGADSWLQKGARASEVVHRIEEMLGPPAEAAAVG